MAHACKPFAFFDRAQVGLDFWFSPPTSTRKFNDNTFLSLRALVQLNEANLRPAILPIGGLASAARISSQVAVANQDQGANGQPSFLSWPVCRLPIREVPPCTCAPTPIGTRRRLLKSGPLDRVPSCVFSE
jgi:hypothetical protein